MRTRAFVVAFIVLSLLFIVSLTVSVWLLVGIESQVSVCHTFLGDEVKCLVPCQPYLAGEVIGKHESVSFLDGQTRYFIHVQREHHVTYMEVSKDLYQVVCVKE